MGLGSFFSGVVDTVSDVATNPTSWINPSTFVPFNTFSSVSGGGGGGGAGIPYYNVANPTAPTYENMRDSEGLLRPEFQGSLGSSYSALRDKGMTEGDTRSAGLMRDLSNQQAMNQKDIAQRMNASGVSKATDQLAMRGGLRSGAAERLAGQGQRGLMRDVQNIGRQQGLDNLNISLQDEQMKNQLLGKVAPAEQMVQEGNINRLQQDLSQQNRFKQNQYDTDKRAWASGMTANAQIGAANAAPSLWSSLSGGLL